MKITARCHPLLEPLLPKPIPASKGLPDWLKKMPSEVAADSLAGQVVRTLKHCPPFIDALGSGILLLSPTDITVENGEVSWDWTPPLITDTPIGRAPVGIHVPEQAEGSPVDTGGTLILKFTNYWTLEVPDGWSILFCQPFNRPDLPFTTLAGVVDCDKFKYGYVHFPVVLDPNFSGTIQRGTPIVQAMPFRREELELQVTTMKTLEITENRKIQEALARKKGVYRKNYKN